MSNNQRAGEKSNVFISYAREDKAHAKKLAEFLEAQGHNVWWDPFIIAGTDYRAAIQQQLDQSDKVIVIWSSHSVRSPFVIDEAQRGQKKNKLIPIVIDVAEPPMGFGHLHSVQAKDLETEYAAILAAVEDRSPPTHAESQATPTAGLNPAHDYQAYSSDTLGLEFVYPQAVLQVDTTQEKAGKIPLITKDRQVEVLISRYPLPDHNNIRIGCRKEREELEEKGYTFNYIGPRKDKNWSNWYILTGLSPNDDEYFYKRWYTDKDVVSIEFNYPKSKIGLYNDVIPAMTLENRFKVW